MFGSAPILTIGYGTIYTFLKTNVCSNNEQFMHDCAEKSVTLHPNFIIQVEYKKII
jgi:hypothetical protein